MDNQRMILYVALALVLYLLWQTWQQEHAPSPPVAQIEQINQNGQSGVADQPAAAAVGGGNDVPDVPDDLPDSPAISQQEQVADVPAVQPSAPAATDSRVVRVFTDVFAVEIDTRGGTIVRADLPTYPRHKDQPDVPFRLFDNSAKVYLAQSGLLHARTDDGADLSTLAPSHHAIYKASQSEYSLADDADELRVPLTWVSDAGVTVTKTYTFQRGQFAVGVEHKVANGSDAPWSGRQYRQLRHDVPNEDDKQAFIYTFTGGAWYDGEKYDKVDFDDMADDPLSQNAVAGWAAIIQHYFTAAWIPVNEEEENHYYTKGVRGGNGPEYIIGLRSPAQTVTPGGSAVFESTLFMGPKVQAQLKPLAKGMRLVVDYGYLTVLANPIFWLLEKIHSFVGNWGWAIIFLTMLIKLAFYKLSEASYRSMAKMRAMQPRMVALRERYSGDKQRMNQELMTLYKKEKINPLGGCLPILIQIPVFISLYWVLLESVEMRQAPFMLWLTDLSDKDPYFVLPLIMGVSMWIQQKLNPAPLDPMQAKVMMLLPFVFTVFFAFFPSGLVLYWCVNNILSIAQQWVITKRITEQTAAAT